MRDQENRLLQEVGELLATHYDTLAPGQQDSPAHAFGRYLRACRECQEISIQELAQKAGVPQVEVLAYERGLLPQRSVRVDSLQRWASALEEEIDAFLLLLQSNPLTPADVGRGSPLLCWLAQPFTMMGKLTLRQAAIPLTLALLLFVVVVTLEQPGLGEPNRSTALSLAPGQPIMVEASADNSPPMTGDRIVTAPPSQEVDTSTTLLIRFTSQTGP